MAEDPRDRTRSIRFAVQPSESLAAYHAGQGNADRWLAGDGEIGFPDTRTYVANVLEFRDIYRETYESQLGPRARASASPDG